MFADWMPPIGNYSGLGSQKTPEGGGERKERDLVVSARVKRWVSLIFFRAGPYIQILDLFSRPRRLSQECEARLDAWV
jgi:hypothetical protein